MAKGRKIGAQQAPAQQEPELTPLEHAEFRLQSVTQYHENNLEFLRDGIRDVAARLRRLADEVERIANEQYDDDLNAPIRKVERVQHNVLWGVANLNLDMLLHRVRDLGHSEKRLQECRALLEELKAQTPANTDGE